MQFFFVDLFVFVYEDVSFHHDLVMKKEPGNDEKVLKKKKKCWLKLSGHIPVLHPFFFFHFYNFTES